MLMRNMCFMSTNKQHMLIICMLSVNNENWSSVTGVIIIVLVYLFGYQSVVCVNESLLAYLFICLFIYFL